MIARLLDKLVFGAALLVALQLPLLVDHYHQYLSGWHKATQWQVDGYQATAKEHGFADVQAMIRHHLSNSEPSVRADAEQKQQTVELLAELNSGITTFDQGYLPEKILFMLHPERIHLLKDVAQNFKVGIPLHPGDLGFAVLIALLLNVLITLPFALLRRPAGSKRRNA